MDIPGTARAILASGLLFSSTSCGPAWEDFNQRAQARAAEKHEARDAERQAKRGRKETDDSSELRRRTEKSRGRMASTCTWTEAEGTVDISCGEESEKPLYEMTVDGEGMTLDGNYPGLERPLQLVFDQARGSLWVALESSDTGLDIEFMPGGIIVGEASRKTSQHSGSASAWNEQRPGSVGVRFGEEADAEIFDYDGTVHITAPMVSHPRGEAPHPIEVQTGWENLSPGKDGDYRLIMSVHEPGETTYSVHRVLEIDELPRNIVEGVAQSDGI